MKHFMYQHFQNNKSISFFYAGVNQMFSCKRCDSHITVFLCEIQLTFHEILLENETKHRDFGNMDEKTILGINKMIE